MKMEMRNVFISHIHEDDSGLAKLKSLLFQKGLKLRDYSITAEKPNRAKSEGYIKYGILGPRIKQTGVLIVYVTEDTKKSKWVNWEIESAHKQGKRIVGVWAHGEKGCEIPRALDDYGDALVGWNGSSIVDAINGDFNGFEVPGGGHGAYRPIPRAPC